METTKKIGEDGISVNENDRASRYCDYAIYRDMKSCGWSDEKFIKNTHCTQEDIDAMKKEFGG